MVGVPYHYIMNQKGLKKSIKKITYLRNFDRRQELRLRQPFLILLFLISKDPKSMYTELIVDSRLENQHIIQECPGF